MMKAAEVIRMGLSRMRLASIAACHKLWYLGLCAKAGISVLRYRDDANQDTVSLRARPITLILYNHSDDG